MSSSVFGAIPEKRTPQLQVVLDLLIGFCHKEFDKVSTLITDDYVHSIFPKSLGIPPSDKASWIQQLRENLPIYNDFKVRFGSSSLCIESKIILVV